MKKIFLLSLFSLVITIASSQIVLDSIPDGSGYTYIASPTGTGPFPAVLYNHGGLGTSVGGDLRGTAIALAQAGYFVRCEKRMETVPITGHLQEVEDALDSLRADARADTSCVSIIGFSRGGYLTLEAAKQNPGKVHGIISMAPANPNNLLVTLVTDVSPINDPVLILVANNDTVQDNHVALAQMVYDSLIAGGKTATQIIYPGYDSNGDLIVDGSDDGHELFFAVQNPYWTDILNFLNANCSPNGLNDPDEEIKTIEIYPNPFATQTTLRTDNLLQNATLMVDNYLGQTVAQIKNINGQTITLYRDNLPSGLYFVHLTQDNQVIATKKLIITD